MRKVISVSLLFLIICTVGVKANTEGGGDEEEEAISCAFDPEDERFKGVDPSEQNTIDKLIQKIQGTPMGGAIRRLIKRQLQKPNSLIQKLLGNTMQDPHDENFEEGEVNVEKPVYGPTMSLITKIFGETRTVVGYLKSFGFFAKVLGMSPNKMENYQGSIPPCAITLAVKEFQVFNNLEPTGRLTKETRELMAKERCGNPDVKCETAECAAEEEAEEDSEYLDRRRRSLSREKRWDVVSGRTWRNNVFKYFYESYTDDLSKAVQRAEIEKSLREWSEVADISFVEVDNEREADVVVGFGGGDHGDRYPFSGPGGVLAHGFYPRKGDMHFDDDELYTANSYSGTNLYYVATHEFGHVLGIRHTNIRGAVMYPYYPGFRAEIELADDDIGAARQLFGKGVGTVTPLQQPGEGSGSGGRRGDSEDGPGPDNIEEGPGPDNIEAPVENEEETATEEGSGPDNIEEMVPEEKEQAEENERVEEEEEEEGEDELEEDEEDVDVEEEAEEEVEEEIISCAFDPEDERFKGVDPSEQNTIDKLIQKIQGTPFGGMIRRLIKRQLQKPDSLIRRLLGNTMQDPHDENFEEGEVNVEKPVYGPTMSLITKIFGETRTVVGYLRSFGFFAKVLGMSPNKMENYQGSIPPCAITLAVKEFQVFNNLEPTGRLTKETRELMAKDRCGNPDVKCETAECAAEEEAEEDSEYLDRRRRSLSREKRWDVVSGRTWRNNVFKYFYESYTDDLSKAVQRAEIEKSLREWSEVADISFIEVDNEREADVVVGFGGGDHGDRYPFSGPGGVLAHGFYPRKGDMHFDDDELYTANSYSGTNLYYVATHEFGHVLGIRHTNIRGAVMYPYYPGFRAEIELADDDIGAARQLFGKGVGTVTPLQQPGEGGGSSGGRGDSEDGPGPDNIEEGPGPDNIEEGPGPDNIEEGPGPDNIEEMVPEESEEEECLSQIDAAFNHPTQKYAYVISRDRYVRLEANDRNMPVVSEGYPKLVSEEWPGVDGEVDAAFTDYEKGRTFFFVKGEPRRKVYCWNWEKGVMEMTGEDEGDTVFSPLPQVEIKGIASYRDHVVFLFEGEYYLWTPRVGVYSEAQTWPYQSGEKSLHVSGAFNAFLRGYFYTGSERFPEKYALFRSHGLISGSGGMVEKYTYRRFEDDMNLRMCF